MVMRERSLASHLRAQLTSAAVIAPGDPGYDEARAVFLRSIDRRPAAIVRPPDAGEAAAVVAFAAEHGVELAVRSGGHSGAGHSTSDGGIVLDLARLDVLEIDAEARTVTAGSGLTAGSVTSALAADGLAVPFGDAGPVGIGGLTLGGGMGYLVRRHGLTIDSLLGAEVVTADGRVLQVDRDHHADLFWALRGGGGNFGVVTRFRYRAHPVSTITGGMLLLPATAETLAGFVAAAAVAADDVSTIGNVVAAPALPFVPAEHQGRPMIAAMVVHSGDPADAEAALAPFRALAPPFVDMIAPQPYPALFAGEGPADGPPLAVMRTFFSDGLDRDRADELLVRLSRSPAATAAAQLRVLGGAAARVGDGETAYAHRGRRLLVNVAALFEGADETPVHTAWADGAAAALRTGAAGAYVNFLGDEGDARVRSAYPGATWERLVAVKRRYDPQNVFHLNQNVPPDDG
jgi:FAD/FMN-containing dehydrogenase